MGIFGRFGKKGRKSGMVLLKEIEETAPVTARKLDPIVQFVKNVAAEDEVPAALALKLLILNRNNSNEKLVKILSNLPNKIDRVEEPSVLIDSYKYAAFLVAEIEKRISALPYSDEKREEVLKSIIEIVQGILYNRAISKAKSPSDLQRISDAFFVPLPVVRKHWEYITGKRKDNHYYKNTRNNRTPRKSSNTAPQKKEQKEQSNNGGDQE